MVTLKSRKDFLSLRKNSRKNFLNDYSMVVYKPNQNGELRVGWTLSAKVGKANTRNKIKRWLRYYFRNLENQDSMQGYDLNVIFRKSDKIKELNYQEVKNSLDKFTQNFR